jgi:DNA-binding beta-propeller fold protein YncE
VYVSDLAARKVHVFDFGQAKYSLLKDGDRFRRPVGLATDPQGNVYVADSGSGAVLVFDPKGKFQRYLKESKGRESYFEAPWGIAVDPAGARIYVCDSPRHMVVVLDRKGRVLSLLGKRGGGTGPGEFRYPTQVAISADEVFILDTGNRRVQVLDRRGHFRREVPIAESDRRSGLAVDEGKKIYISDPVVDFVQVYSRDGLLYSFGQLGHKPGEFQGPSGLWWDSAHCLYVVDANNKRVQVFQVQQQNKNSCWLR